MEFISPRTRVQRPGRVKQKPDERFTGPVVFRVVEWSMKKQEFFRLDKAARLQPVDVNSARQSRSVEFHLMVARLLFTIDEQTNRPLVL